MIKCIIEAVLSSFSRQSCYTTVVYPYKGKAVILHDGLNVFGGPDSREVADVKGWDDAGHLSPFYVVNEIYDGLEIHRAPELPDFSANEGLMFNPANGLPMLDGTVDVMGSPVGFDMHEIVHGFQDFSAF